MASKTLAVFFDDGSLCPQLLGRCDERNNLLFFTHNGLDQDSDRKFNPARSPIATTLICDSLPDSWGRKVFNALLSARARRDERPFSSVDDFALLSNLCDSDRMGALRFADTDKPHEYLGLRRFSAPQECDIAELNDTARSIERSDLLSAARMERFAENAACLGGSRPKVGFVDSDGRLCIAKLPSENDDRDKAAWEYCLIELAKNCGIRTPTCRLLDVNDPRGRIFVSVRFDRTPQGRRRHFLSARALLGASDNRELRCYKDLVSLIKTICDDPQSEFEELWRRTVFKCLVHDGDDHLRNQGFLLTEHGWRLSPAFDLNASCSQTRFTLCYAETRRELNLESLMQSVGDDWSISESRAECIVQEVSKSIRQWQETAASLGIREQEIEHMRLAFTANQLVF